MMFEKIQSLINLFDTVNSQNHLGFKKHLEKAFVLGTEYDGFPRIPYRKGVFDNTDKRIELFLETIGFLAFPNRVQIKTSNDYALENIICVNFFEFDGTSWRYFPAFDMEAIENDFDAEYEKQSELLTPNTIQQIFECL